MITLLVMSDGRGEYLQRTIASFDEMVKGTITRKVIHDDSGDPEYSTFLQTMHWGCEIIGGERVGYAGAVQRAWNYLDLRPDGNRFTFHLEDDFVFNRPVDLDEIADFMDEHWWLAQMALRRGRWGREERGFVEDAPSAYEEMKTVAWAPEQRWIEHRNYYTMTPHLYRSRLRLVPWPSGEGSEIHYKDRLLQQGLPWSVLPGHVKFGFWGGVEDGANAVTHIGEERRGHGY